MVTAVFVDVVLILQLLEPVFSVCVISQLKTWHYRLMYRCVMNIQC